MEKKSFLHLLVLLCCTVNLSRSQASQGRLCQEKAAIFDTLTRQLTQVLTEKNQHNYLICPKLTGYISHALYTKQTCPDLPLVQNSTFLNTVVLMQNDFNDRCDADEYNIVVYPCSPAMVKYLVENCNQFIDQVQFWMPRLQVCENGPWAIAITTSLCSLVDIWGNLCREYFTTGQKCFDHNVCIKQAGSNTLVAIHICTRKTFVLAGQADITLNQDNISKNFISCQEQALEECSHSDLFARYHVNEALQITRDSLNYLCDASLADEPWENGPDRRRRRSIRSLRSVTDPECPSEIKEGRSISDVCTEQKERRFPEITLGSEFVNICRVLDFMFGCASDLFRKCANSTPEDDKRYFLDNFMLVYNAYSCTNH